jgi:outer membrane protein OmpA-like peptidoglycan-associated protein
MLLLSVYASIAVAAPRPLPAALAFPRAITVDEAAGTWLEFTEASVTVDASDHTRIVSGQLWTSKLAYAGLPETADNFAVLDGVVGAMRSMGFTLLKRYESLPPTAALHLSQDGHEYWAEVAVAFADDVRLRVLMPSPNPVRVKLAPPAAPGEPMPSDAQDFPFLSSMPGSEGPQTSALGSPFVLAVPGHVEETQVVASDAIVKSYIRPSLSNAQLLAVYHPALVEAGWTITHEVTEASNIDASIEAHFARNGRDLWLEIRRVGDSNYQVRAADAGSRDFGSTLVKECHVALDGVRFDFSKATLQADSDAVLHQALLAVRQNPTLALEVQGHTDSVGSDEANQRLSEARARAVMEWLVAKGASAQQLTAKGYGESQPVDDNATPEGRARNRRVELACRK